MGLAGSHCNPTVPAKISLGRHKVGRGRYDLGFNQQLFHVEHVSEIAISGRLPLAFHPRTTVGRYRNIRIR